MSIDQALILGILLLALGLFLWGRLRHDVVALAALMGAVVAGVVPADEAFYGFGHPAVVTVACVLVLSRGLQTSGAVDVLARAVLPSRGGRLSSMLALLLLGAGLSAFMNNVGAMALLMPVAVQLAGRLGLTPGQVLMPLAFGTILGGMTTLVGTPPNLIVSGFRYDAGLGAFGMFDFTPVGAAVAAAGVVFVVLVGWRLVPARRPVNAEAFDTAAYFTEVRVGKGSRAVGLTLRAIEQELADVAAQVVALVRRDVRLHAPHAGRVVRTGDILVLEADVDGLAEALSKLNLRLEEEDGAAAGASAAAGGKARARSGRAASSGRSDGAAAPPAARDAEAPPRRDDIVLRELVVLPGSALVGRSAAELLLRSRHGLNLLAVSREGGRPQARLRDLRLRTGDVLLIQGPAEVVAAFAGDSGCVPLAERELRIPDTRLAILSAVILAGAVAVAALGLLPAAAAFGLGVLASMLLRTVPPRAVYGAIDWPVIVLLGALIPVAAAMEATGAAALVAEVAVETVAQGHATVALGLMLVATMFLSDVMNNAATAAVMCPIALGIAGALDVDPDAFLMAVAIGASCAFLTPIGHQNNALILGPGGFRFGDYWRLGLPMEILVVALALPLLLLVWPL